MNIYNAQSRKTDNQIKAKGLQKVKYYCQMCQKQCRDANGFKCHCETEGHRRMMELYASDPMKYQKDFSNQFQNGFIRILQTQYKRKQVNANIIYNEYIQDKNHIHMNSTQWTSLSGFVRYLETKGIIELEEKDEGLFIKLIEPEDDNDEPLNNEDERDELKEVLDSIVKQNKLYGINEQNINDTIVKEKKPIFNKFNKKEKKISKTIVFDDEDLFKKSANNQKKKKTPITNPNQMGFQ
ncbi:hypothetical protein ENUP19_0054G0121 [Entamoeba nuttalli]|uniref:DNA/RNA-binding protein Kin17 WH-like domain-containing protein n=2 Tax=Entamoeba nuttalli TaxID=412467 RepID=K2GXF5_ENTNP|nr:hypothetical protein ENU1_164420 [Entamoeba nuttalli P19]EKE38487.1 hypothetical protein ENU1_164420 [Entamoeba nuttalli P19]|eukprot:XP_008859168.1 hypothetical protein ENU1_164420 [Entamoeba nuttalli P19]